MAMNGMNDLVEMVSYLDKAAPETIDACKSTYGDTPEAGFAAAECVYIMQNKRLPSWGIAIQSFDFVNGSFIFVHNDNVAIDRDKYAVVPDDTMEAFNIEIHPNHTQ